MTEHDENELKSLVTSLRQEIDAMKVERDGLREQVSLLRDGVARLNDRLLNVESAGLFDEPQPASPTPEEPTDQALTIRGPVPDEENRQVVVPDVISMASSGMPRRSMEWTPELYNALQLNEFDDAPSVGALTIKRKGAKLVIADPDGTSGTRKWLVPLRRENTGSIELKWAKFGDGSDGDSDSDSDAPCYGDMSVEVVGAQTGHPNGGYKVTITHPDCTSEEHYVWNGDDGQDGSDGDDGQNGCSPLVELFPYEPPPGSPPMPNAVVLRVTLYEPDGEGGCKIKKVPGESGPVDYVQTVISDGAPGADGCPPIITPCATPYEHGDCACTIQPQTTQDGFCVNDGDPITVYHGKNGTNGRDGCSPVITPSQTPSVHGDAAYTIQAMTAGDDSDSDCDAVGNAVTVYHGKNATVCGTFPAGGEMKFENNKLWFRSRYYEFQYNSTSGCYQPSATNTYTEWAEVTGLQFYTCTPS